MKKLLILITGAVFCVSCSTLYNPDPIPNTIHIYENQPEIIEGTYFNNPYSYTYDHKTLLDFFKISNHNVDSIQLSLLGPKKLKVITYKALDSDTTFVKGKLKKGYFQIKNKHFFFGIPYLLFFNSKEKIRIGVGVLDEIVVQRYQYEISHFFGHVSEESTTDYYQYSKTLEVIP